MGKGIPEFSNVGFGYVGYWKSRVRAGNEISGIGYSRVICSVSQISDASGMEKVGFGRVISGSGIPGPITSMDTILKTHMKLISVDIFTCDVKSLSPGSTSAEMPGLLRTLFAFPMNFFPAIK